MMFGRNLTVFCLLFLTVDDRVLSMSNNRTNSAKCYIKITSKFKTVEKEGSCIIRYDIEGCGDDKPIEVQLKNEEEMEIEEMNYSFESSFVNVSLPVFTQGIVVLFIRDFKPLMNSLRCVHIHFDVDNVQPDENVSVHADFLELQDGNYNIMGFFAQQVGSEKYYKLYAESVIAHRIYEVGTEAEFSDASNASHHRQIRSKKEKNCSCCIQTSYGYESSYGLLQFFYSFPNGPCDKEFQVKLFRHGDASVNSEAKCLQFLSLESLHRSGGLSYITQVGPSRNVSGNTTEIESVDFPNTPTGCYIIRTFSGVYHDFFWVKSDNIADMNCWNVTLHITQRDFDSSVKVSWKNPDFPFNFTSWKLLLWHSEDENIVCEGKDSDRFLIQIIHSEPPIINETSYLFRNLSFGFYCARIIPYDVRCPRDGCVPRSTHTIQLKGPSLKPLEKEEFDVWIVIVAGGIPVAIVVIIFVSFYVVRKPIYRYQGKSRYSSASAQMDYHFEKVPVLLIWTKCSVEKKKEYETLIKAFKEVLRIYSKCEVFDYLDHGSLDNKERQHLRQDPVQWLQDHLKRQEEKILFVEPPRIRIKSKTTNGADNNSNQKPHQEFFQGSEELDYRLFPHAFRYLRDSVELSSDYSRIFYLRFSGLYSTDNDVEEVVPLVRYTMPDHLRKLTLKLRGLQGDSNCDLGHLSVSKRRDLLALINSCKDENT